MCKKEIKRKKSKNKKLDRSIFIGQNVFIHRAKLDRMKSKKPYFYQMNLSNEKFERIYAPMIVLMRIFFY